MPRVVINQAWWDNIDPRFRYSEPQSGYSRMHDRLSLLLLQSICPHSRGDSIVIVVNDISVGSLGYFARDAARAIGFQVEVSQNG